MRTLQLLQLNADELLAMTGDDNSCVYEDDVPTAIDGGSIVDVHHRITLLQARLIVNRMLGDPIIVHAFLQSLADADRNPRGNVPHNGTHPVNPLVSLVLDRAIFPVLQERPPIDVILHFVEMGYRHSRNAI